ncbi:MAG: hypothetical protein ACU85V_01615, partial [Gammaproteobacteria bacterium]
MSHSILRTVLPGLLSLTALSTDTVDGAERWDPVIHEEELRAVMSDTSLRATLRDGVEASARYNADGTGELRAWGETFPRRWTVKDGTVCIDYGEDSACLEIEKAAGKDTLYRARNRVTAEVLEFSVGKDAAPITVDEGAGKQGGAAKPSADELAKALANPNTPLASLTFKLQHRLFEGELPRADAQEGTTLLFQPALPFPLENGDTVFLRPAMPIVMDQPAFERGADGFDSVAGIGDISFDLAYGRTLPNGLVVAGGLVSTLPTATRDELGADRWSLGPELLLARISKKYVVGALATYQADIAGSGDADVSLSSVNVLTTYLPGGGWNVSSLPVITFDHENNQWNVPLNLTVGKTVIAGGRPWKLSVEFNYYV